jgi:hypothetical protein
MSRTPKTNSIAGLVKSIGPALSFESRTDHGDQPAKLVTRDETAADCGQGGEAAGAVVVRWPGSGGITAELD